jgi:hypothetical protein
MSPKWTKLYPCGAVIVKLKLHKMKVILTTKVVKKAIIYKDEIHMVWEYTNGNWGEEIAIMDSTGYDVSLKTEILEKGELESEAVIHCVDPEEYIHEQFINFSQNILK